MYFGYNNNIIAGCERIIASLCIQNKINYKLSEPNYKQPLLGEVEIVQGKNESQNVGKPKSKTQEDFDHDSRQLCCSIECPKVFRIPK